MKKAFLSVFVFVMVCVAIVAGFALIISLTVAKSNSRKNSYNTRTYVSKNVQEAEEHSQTNNNAEIRMKEIIDVLFETSYDIKSISPNRNNMEEVGGGTYMKVLLQHPELLENH